MMRSRLAAAVILILACGLSSCSSDNVGGGPTAAVADAAESPAAQSPVAAESPDAAETSTAESSTAESSAESAAAGSTGGVCALLDGADLEALLAGPPGEPAEGMTTCMVKQATAGVARIDVDYRPSGGADAYESQNELLGTDGPVAGLGEEAIRTGVRIHARSGDAFLMVQVVRDPMGEAGQASDEELLAFAQLVAGNAGW